MILLLTPHILCFLVSVCVGASAGFVLLGCAFRRGERALEEIIYKKTLLHHEKERLATEAAVVPPTKVETLCRIATYDDNIVGESALQCRAVFLHQTIHIYLVSKLITLADHRQVVVKESFIGKINTNCVTAKKGRISKYHRHADKSSQLAPLKGKCVVLEAVPPSTVFLINPLESHSEPGQSPHYFTRFGPSLPSAVDSIASSSHGSSPWDVENETEDVRRAGDFFSRRREFEKFRFSNRAAPVESGQDTEAADGLLHVLSAERSQDLCRLRKAKKILLKFPTLRENERWLNLLQPTSETRRWREALFHLPAEDLLNIMVARVFVENTKSPDLNDYLRNKVSTRIKEVLPLLPASIHGTKIFLDRLAIGNEIPLISNVSHAVVSNDGNIVFEFDGLYRGGLTMVLRFDVRFHGMKAKQIAFTVEILELSAHCRIHICPSPSEYFLMGLKEMPQFSLHITQEKVSDKGILHWIMRFLPNLSGIATGIIKVALFEDMQLPLMESLPLPLLEEILGEA